MASKKLYAGYADSRFEYALWAESKTAIEKRLGVSDGFHEQPRKGELAAIIADREFIYRRKLDDVSEWEKWEKF